VFKISHWNIQIPIRNGKCYLHQSSFKRLFSSKKYFGESLRSIPWQCGEFLTTLIALSVRNRQWKHLSMRLKQSGRHLGEITSSLWMSSFRWLECSACSIAQPANAQVLFNRTDWRRRGRWFKSPGSILFPYNLAQENTNRGRRGVDRLVCSVSRCICFNLAGTTRPRTYFFSPFRLK